MKRPLIQKIVSRLAVAALALCAVPGAIAGVPIVNWGGNYYTNDSTTDLNILDNYPEDEKVSLPNGILLPYSETIKKSPANANYSGVSPSFYGAVQLTTGDGSGGGKMQVRIQRNEDVNRIHLNTLQATPTNPANVQGFFFWKKGDFLAGFDAKANLALSELSQLSLNVPKAFAKTMAVRFAVQSDGVWYLSEPPLTGTYYGTAPGEHVMDDPASSHWAAWTPDRAPLDPEPLHYEVQGSSLNHITAVGFYFNATYQASNSASLDFDSFKVSAKSQEPTK